jgi:lipopolysaccharide/colanic/teichoic acid biosynthesis glycosyltransferase
MKSVWENLRGLFGRLVGLLALVVFLPTLLLLAIFLRTNSDEPVLLTDLFVGRAGRPVRSYRFRTTGRGTSAFCVVGRFLRMYSMDELPGFLAIVRGQCGLLDILRPELRK